MPEILPDQSLVVNSGIGGIGGAGASSGASGVSVTGGAGIASAEALNVSTTEIGKNVQYTLVVVVPVPFLNLNLNLDLVGAFVLPAFTALGIPKATASLMSNINNLMENVFADIQDLIRAVPEMVVSVVVKLGSVIVFNFLFVVEKVPTVITPPTFQLALPNLAVDANLSAGITIPAASPIIVRVPIPWPIYNPVPLIGISGGQVSASASTNTTTTSGSSFSATGAAGAGGGATVGGAAAIGPSVETPTSAATAGAIGIDTTGKTTTVEPTAVNAGSNLPTFIQIPVT